MIKVVLVDIDNTILDFEKCAKEAIKQACVIESVPFFDYYFDVFTEINNMLWKKVELKEITRDYLHSVRFDMVFGKLGVKANGLNVEKLFKELLVNIAIKENNAEEFMKYLSSKYIVCTASNSEYKQQFSRLSKANFIQYVKDVFVSDDIGYEKPSEKFFEYIFKKYPSVKLEEFVFIGDSLSADISGGKAVNIKTVWYNKFKVDAPCNADYTITDLLDIKNIL